MNELIPQTKWQAIGMIGIAGSQLLIEYWLGKTDKVRAASIIELIILFLEGIRSSLKK